MGLYTSTGTLPPECLNGHTHTQHRRPVAAASEAGACGGGGGAAVTRFWQGFGPPGRQTMYPGNNAGAGTRAWMEGRAF